MNQSKAIRSVLSIWRMFIAVVASLMALHVAAVQTIDTVTLDGTDVTYVEDTVISNLIVSAQTKVTINEGVTVDVLSYSGAELCKFFGKGAVRITDLAGDDGYIEANGSIALKFLEPSVGTNTHELAASASFHVDALDSSSFVASMRGGTNYVSRWKDVRGDGYMYAENTDESAQPFLVPGAFPWIDMGGYRASGMAGHGGHLKWSQALNGIREVFIVLSDTDDVRAITGNIALQFLLTSTSASVYDFHRGYSKNDGFALFTSQYTSEYITNGTITVDCEATGPFSPFPTGFHLVHIRTTGPVRADSFASDRALRYGGQRIREAIIFDSLLDDEAQALLEARLRAKWFRKLSSISIHGTATMEAATPISVSGSIFSSPDDANAFSGEIEVNNAGMFGKVVVESGRLTVTGGNCRLGDVVGEVVGRNATSIYRLGEVDDFAKTSWGEMSVRALSATNVSVESGSLSIEMLSPSLGSYFHVDASDSATVMKSGDTTNGMPFVSQWRCVRGQNKRYSSGAAGTMPFLRPNYLNGLPVMDFGGLMRTQSPTYNGYGGYMAWSHTNSAIREVFWVYSDTEDWADKQSGKGAGPFLLGGMGTYAFHRGYSTPAEIIAYKNADECVRLGTWRLDGMELESPTNTALTAGFHAIHMRTKNNTATKASAFASDRDLMRGGQRLAEVVVYNAQTTDTERDAVEAYLRNKWLDVGVPGGEYGTVYVAESASVALPRYASASLVRGAGSVVVRGGLTVKDISGSPSFSGNLNLAEGSVLSMEGGRAVSANGTVTLPSNGTIVIGEDSRPSGPLNGSSVTVISAGSISADAGLEGWNVVTSGFGKDCSIELSVEDGDLKATFHRGMIIFVL